ncbi:MAG: exodeoxyribonuclease V subunit gamma, partial [Ignavibacteriales bacterium]|nr:exodeoxyribonuclease V subunit gamma [Ignavibacteriales bacterium]
PELSLLYNLSTVDDIGIVVSFDYHLENDNVFGHLRENYEKLLNMGFCKITTHLETDKSFVNHITKYLCNPGKNDIRFNANRFVSLLATEDRLTEVELIAKIVKGLTKENPGRDLSRICVAMFQLQVYTNLFREVFERYGIPVNITDRYYLDQSPLIVSIISLLTIPQHNYRLTDIMRALSSPYLRIMNDQEIIDASNLYEIAILLKISSGYDRWITRIEHRLKQIPGEIDEFDDPVEAKRLLHETEMLEKAKSDIECLKNVLHRFDGEMSPGEFKENLLNLMDELRVAECILQGAVSLNDDEKLEKDTRAYQKFLSFIDDFLEILQFEGKNNIRERLPYYVERLQDAVSQVRYNIRQKYGYGVSITSIDETRGLHFDVMIIAGMIDGEFPSIYQPEIFFSSTRRAQKERYHLHEHRYLFYQALTNFTEHLYLTYPKSDSDVELVPSSFLNDLLKIVDLEVCREDIPLKYSGRIYSQDDFIRFIGKNTDRLGENSTTVLSRHQELKKVFDHMCRAAAIECNTDRSGWYFTRNIVRVLRETKRARFATSFAVERRAV